MADSTSRTKRAGWPQNTSEFSECTFVREPVEGLGHEDSVNRHVSERDLLRRPAKQLGLRTACDEPPPHLRIRLDRKYVSELVYEQSVSLPVPAPSSSTTADLGRPRRERQSARSSVAHARNPHAIEPTFRSSASQAGRLHRRPHLKHAWLHAAAAAHSPLRPARHASDCPVGGAPQAAVAQIIRSALPPNAG